MDLQGRAGVRVVVINVAHLFRVEINAVRHVF